MDGQRNGQRREQLTLALGERREVGGDAVSMVTSARTRIHASRDARGRFVAGACATATAPRVRTLPARGSRGRFVAYPTANAPSWYVFCCDGYRIAGEPAAPLSPTIAPRQHELPRAIVCSRRPRATRVHLENTFAFLLLMITLAWYWWHLPATASLSLHQFPLSEHARLPSLRL